ncbi:class I SAM-dependent methyltransferase [Chloroflexota bacterium]
MLEKLDAFWRQSYESLVNFLFYLPWGSENLLRTKTVEFANLAIGEQVLDLCCGSGKLISYISPYVTPNGHVTGVDICESALRIARKKTKNQSITLHLALATHLPFRTSLFDKCFISMGLHHMSKQDRYLTLREVCRVLKTGGSLIVVEYHLPEKALSRVMAYAFIKLDKSAEAYKMITSASLIKEIEIAGLKIKRRKPICRDLFQLVEAIRILP